MIPKVKDPGHLNEYRPITLVGVSNKIISRVLANRLKKVLSPLISVNQTAFFSDRLILDGPLILNEVISWAKKNQKQIFIFKVDFNKAYDNVNWGFLLSVMEQMGFPDLWCKWIHGILSSARSSVLVNGSPTFEFQCGKGMRQGDPISPFLFLMVMEALSCMMKKAERGCAVSGVSLPNGGPSLTHLLYADDCTFVGEWAESNIKKVHIILRCFFICSGLRINLCKSHLFGVGVEEAEVTRVANGMSCLSGVTPFDYLGIRVGGRMNRVVSWDFLFDIFRARLSRWKASCLSIGGRLTLVKAVLENLPTYYLSLFKAPVKVIDGLESIIRKFLWGGSSEVKKIHWVAWDRVASPIKFGGLGLCKLGDINIALLSKWVWRYRNEPESLWRQVVDAIHGSKRCWSSLPVCSSITGVWNSIVKSISKVSVAGVNLNQLFKAEVGNGDNIRFWLDPWACVSPLKDIFPLSFKHEKDKKCMVSEKYNSVYDRFEGSWGVLDGVVSVGGSGRKTVFGSVAGRSGFKQSIRQMELARQRY